MLQQHCCGCTVGEWPLADRAAEEHTVGALFRLVVVEMLLASIATGTVRPYFGT
jgi:hypothetical protein